MSEALRVEVQRTLLCMGCSQRTTVLMRRDEAVERTGSYMNVPDKYQCECGCLRFKVLAAKTHNSLLDALICNWAQEVN